MCNSKAFFQFVSQIIIKLLALVLSILIITIFPFCFILISPIYIFRIFISQMAKVFKPDLAKILTTRSTLFSTLNVYSSKPKFSIVIAAVVSGNLELETFREVINSKLIKISNENGKLKYPELQQYIFNWMGFVFWKWDEYFNVANHIKLESTRKIYTTQMVNTLRSDLLRKKFQNNRSPWEIIIVQNYIDDQTDAGEIPTELKTIVFLRFHHCLCDGFSILKVILSAFGQEKELQKLNENSKQHFKSSAAEEFTKFWKLLKFPYDFIYTFFDGFSIDPWGNSSSTDLREYNCLSSPKISIEFIKNLKNGYNVAFNSILITALTSGIRKALLKLNKSNRPIPKSILAPYPLPVQGHPNSLRNYTTVGFVKLPVGEPDSITRLNKCHNVLLNSNNKSSIPIGMFFMQQIIGGMFHWMITPFVSGIAVIGGVTLSIFPGSKTVLSAGGHNVLDFTFSFSFPPGNIGIGFGILSYGDGLKINIIVDKSIFPSESQVQEILDTILQELQILRRNLN